MYLTGWSASSSAPYINTLLADLSRSDTFRGNQGTFSSASPEKRQGGNMLVVCFYLWYA